MKKNVYTVAVIVACVSLLVPTASTYAEEEKMNPSEAYEKFTTEMQAELRGENRPKSYEEFVELQKKIAIRILENTDAEGADAEGKIAFARLLNNAGEAMKAVDVCEGVMAGEGKTAQEATILCLEFLTGEEKYDKVTEGIAQYRERFQVSSELPQNLNNVIMALASQYFQKGEHDKVVTLVMDEVNSLDYEYPYNSWLLLSRLATSFKEAGKTELLLEKIDEVTGRFTEISESKMAALGEDASNAEKRLAQTWSRIARGLSNTATQLRLIGQEAPDLTLTRFYNTEETSLDDLKGKVVMVDFWANWCGPCKAAFPHMREMYNEYKDEGFVILGVTSLQGRFSDGDIREASVTQEREFELTEDLIERHDMTWPVVFSEESVFNPDYGVTGIPTFAIVDRKGIVRHIQAGAGAASEKYLEELIPRLISEK